MNATVKLTIAALMASLTSMPALGAVATIDPGQTIALSGITHAEDPSLAGVVAEDWVQDFLIVSDTGATFSGSIQSRVVTRFDNEQLDFSWFIRDTSGVGQISSVVITGFAGWDLGVEWRPDSLGDIGPSHASRTADGLNLGYLFAGVPLNAPDESKFFFARTEAMTYDTSGTVTINLIGGESVTLKTFAPAVPTPGGAAVLALAGLGAARRRRHR